MENEKLPLYIITGASGSGSGKTSIVPNLLKLLPDFEVFDIDDDVIINAVEDW